MTQEIKSIFFHFLKFNHYKKNVFNKKILKLHLLGRIKNFSFEYFLEKMKIITSYIFHYLILIHLLLASHIKSIF